MSNDNSKPSLLNLYSKPSIKQIKRITPHFYHFSEQFPSFFVHHHFSLSTLYYLQLTFGLSGCISPILVYALISRRSSSSEKMFANKGDPEHQRASRPAYKKSGLQDPLLFAIKLSSLAVSALQFALIKLDLNQQPALPLLFIVGLYAFFYSLLFFSLKTLVVHKVRARSVCLLWSWFELVQSIPLLIGVTISGKLEFFLVIEWHSNGIH